MLESITLYLATLSVFIEIINKNNLTDSNTLSEDFYCKLLNKIYGYKLENLNKLQMNFPAIDLGDKSNKICYQITSTSKPKKIKDTLQKFTDKELFYDYKFIYILFIKNTVKLRKTDYGCKLFIFDHTHIKTISDLINDINYKTNREMREISAICEEELKFLNLKSPIKYLDYINETHFKYGNHYYNFIEDSYGYNHNNPSDNEYFTNIKNEIDIFLNYLKELHYNTREIIIIIIKRSVLKNNKILFNENDIRKYMNLDEDTFYKELQILYDKNLIDFKENTYEDANTLFYNSQGQNLLYDISKYCNKHKINKKELFLDLDFRLLD